MPEHLKKLWSSLIRTHGTPPAIALGAAIGMYVGFQPIFGVATPLVLLLATAVGASHIAALIGLHIHSVFFFLWPFVLGINYRIGEVALGASPHLPKIHSLHWIDILSFGSPIIVGGLILGLPAAFLTYLAVLHGTRKFQERRKGECPAMLPSETI